MRPVSSIDLTADANLALIRDTSVLEASSGVELLDVSLAVLADLSTDLSDGVVGRESYATLHGSFNFNISQDLDWAQAIVRPYINLSDNVITERFNMGAYLTSSPKTDAGLTPVTHAVTGYDLLHWLNTPVGEAYVVDAGVGYLAAAETILQAQGIVAYLIDPTQSDKVLAAPRVWVLDANITWLNIVNNLLAGVGYQGLWSDWDGNLRMTPYEVPTDRSAEWLYDVELTTSMLLPERSRTSDFFNAPNRWVFYWAADPETDPPIEGAGIYTFVNERDGPTSVAARGGRIITAAPEQLDVVDQSSLVALARSKIDSDLRLTTTFDVETTPNPMHWHFDRCLVNDPELGALFDVLVTKWSLPLDGLTPMTQSWTLL